MTLPVAVLISGGGSNLQALIDRMEEGSLDVDIRMVLSNKEGTYGLKRAEIHGLPSCVIKHEDFDSRENFDAEMVRRLKKAGVEAIILAGFMRILTPVFLNAFPGGVINIHPALLPGFTGASAQADAAKHGVRISGCSVHFVDDKMDHGAIIIQAAVPAIPVVSAKVLGERILKLEHRILPQAAQWLAEGRLSVKKRFVSLAPADKLPAEKGGGSLVNPPLEMGF